MNCFRCDEDLAVARPDPRTAIHYCPECDEPPRDLTRLEKAGVILALLVALPASLLLIPTYHAVEAAVLAGLRRGRRSVGGFWSAADRGQVTGSPTWPIMLAALVIGVAIFVDGFVAITGLDAGPGVVLVLTLAVFAAIAGYGAMERPRDGGEEGE